MKLGDILKYPTKFVSYSAQSFAVGMKNRSQNLIKPNEERILDIKKAGPEGPAFKFNTFGRGGGIRTRDPLHPMHELSPVS